VPPADAIMIVGSRGAGVVLTSVVWASAGPSAGPGPVIAGSAGVFQSSAGRRTDIDLSESVGELAIAIDVIAVSSGSH
jgi:hypothetical protein